MRASAARWAGTYSMMETCVPVYHDGRVIAVVTREENLSSPRLSLGFEAWTIAAADTLCQMIARGEYPYDSTPQVTAHGVPRVLDGALLLDAEGRVLQVTPNAVSCLARLGIRHDVKGKVLAQEVTDVIGEGSFIEESMAVVVMGRASWRVEIAARASTISMRALPRPEPHRNGQSGPGDRSHQRSRVGSRCGPAARAGHGSDSRHVGGAWSGAPYPHLMAVRL